jgi:predicted nucleic acid-binding protein
VIGSFAIDTNIAIYAISDGPKCDAATVLLEAGPSISVQLLNEFLNVNLRKRHLPWSEIEELLAVIVNLAAGVRHIDIELHRTGREIAKRYRLAVYDSLIIAAALLDECEVLYSEDMQHGLVIDGRLKIVNPFLPDPS